MLIQTLNYRYLKTPGKAWLVAIMSVDGLTLHVTKFSSQLWAESARFETSLLQNWCLVPEKLLLLTGFTYNSSPPTPHIFVSESGEYYSEKAWACVQNGITQRGRLADGDMTTLCNAILNTYQMPSRFYIIPSNVNKSQTRLLKPFLARDLMEGHIRRQNTLRFALVFCFELRARATRTCCHCHLAVKNPIHDGKRGLLKLPKSHERYHNVVMWHWIMYKWRRSNQMLSFHRTFFNLLDFTVSLSCRDWHSETPWSHSSNQPGGTYCQAQDFLLRTNYTLEMWCANKKSPNQVPTSHVKTLVIPMSWSYRCFE